LKFTSSAKEDWIAWHDDHGTESSQPHFPKELKGFYAKLKGYCARFALIHAVCLDPKTQNIERESVEAACKLTNYFKDQARAILPHLKCNKISQQESCERAILKALEGGIELPRRELQRKWKGPAKIFNETIGALVEAERVKEKEIEKENHQGKRVLFILNNETEKENPI